MSLTKEQEEYILENYQAVSGRKIRSKFGITQKTLKDFFDKNGLKRASRRAVHDLDDNYFNDESKFTGTTWFLIGFIIADGNIAKPLNRQIYPSKLTVALNSKDVEILELLKKELKATNPIVFKSIYDKRTDKEYQQVSFSCHSGKICRDLEKYGVVPAKGGKEFLPKIPDEFFYHFLAGLFSGDGCISTAGKYTYRFDICSQNEQFLNDIQSRVGFGWIRFQQGNIYRWNVTNIEDLLTIIDRLLTSPDLITRKKDIFLYCKKMRIFDILPKDHDDIKILRKNGMSARSIATFYMADKKQILAVLSNKQIVDKSRKNRRCIHAMENKIW